MMVSARPSGAKPVNVRGMSVSNWRTSSSESKLLATSASPVTGLTALHPAAAPTAETSIRIAMMMAKIATGSGSLLPSRSIASRKRSPKLRVIAPGSAVVAMQSPRDPSPIEGTRELLASYPARLPKQPAPA
jgi:hypothetical protein